MRSYVFVWIAMLFFTGCDNLFYKQGNGEMVVNRFQVESFDEINIKGNFEIFLKHDQDPMVVLKVDENLENDVVVESRNGVLSIDTVEPIRSEEGIKVFIGYQHLRRITCGGASSIFTEEEIRTDDLELSMSGAGIMEMDVATSQLIVELSGAGILNLRGTTDALKLSMSGAGSFEGEKLRSKDADVRISGVGGAKIHVTGELEAAVSGVGGIEYSGNPTQVNRHVSGIGNISASD